MADKIDIFTAALRTEFLTGFNAIAEPAPIDQAVMVIPSTARAENYAWMSPVPGIDRYKGYRRLGKIAETKYRVENLEYDSSFEVLARDVRDSQVAGYISKMPDLGKKAKLFGNKSCLKTLAAGASTTCFDGSNFFAATHTLGIGSNILTATAASGDAATCRIAALVTQGAVRPLIWQNRFGPDLETDAGSPQSKFNKMLRYWVDMEGASAFGWWWDAVLMTITNTPTIAELQTYIGQIESQFRLFTLPVNLPTDVPEYVHEQTEFSDKNLVFVVSTNIGQLMRSVLTLSLIANTENIFKGYAKQVTSAYMN